MKTKNMLWAALSMTAALVMTACSNDDNMVDTPAAPQDEVKTIPYSVTVSQGGDATTRATVDSDNKTLRFATGDKLYITGTNVKGVLEITSGVGETTGATFSGDLTYTGEGSPASNLSLTATLVSAQQTVGTEVSVYATGAVTVNYPTTAYCDDVATAVQKYSNLSGSLTYGEKEFTLYQTMAFLNFEITFEDGTADGTTLTAVVSNGDDPTPLCCADVTTTTEGGKVVAKFVLPVDMGTTLSGATVKMGGKAAFTINDARLDGKVYNVKRTYAKVATPPLTLTSPTVGQVIGSDGKNYAVAEVPTGVTAVAMIAYVSGSNGLAIALSDEVSMKWASAVSTAATHTPIFTDGTWKLPSQDEWKQMFSANGGNNENSYSGLNTALAAAGGDSSKLKEYDIYWSSSEYDHYGVYAWIVKTFDPDDIWGYADMGNAYQVRACLAF